MTDQTPAVIAKRRIQILLDQAGFYTAQELANFAVIPETQDTCPVTRGYIRDMINEGHLIGSSSRGYYIMRDAHEIQRYMNALMKRQIGLGNRIQAVFNAGVKKGILK